MAQPPKLCSGLFLWLEKKRSPEEQAPTRCFRCGPEPSSWPCLFTWPARPQRGGRDRAPQGAARDPERKGPSLGPNAGGVSLDRRRLGTTAETGDKVTYQSRFGARADTPRPTGNAELFKRPYRLLYLSRRKASCRETKDVPYLEIQTTQQKVCTGDAQ